MIFGKKYYFNLNIFGSSHIHFFIPVHQFPLSDRWSLSIKVAVNGTLESREHFY
jgi:hypothetical protein